VHPHHPNHPCASTRPFMKRRQDEYRLLIVMTLRPEPHIDPMLAREAALKMLSRQYELRCEGGDRIAGRARALLMPPPLIHAACRECSREFSCARRGRSREVQRDLLGQATATACPGQPSALLGAAKDGQRASRRGRIARRCLAGSTRSLSRDSPPIFRTALRCRRTACHP
jgi:hypothetical protein